MVAGGVLGLSQVHCRGVCGSSDDEIPPISSEWRRPSPAPHHNTSPHHMFCGHHVVLLRRRDCFVYTNRKPTSCFLFFCCLRIRKFCSNRAKPHICSLSVRVPLPPPPPRLPPTPTPAYSTRIYFEFLDVW